MHDRLNHLSPRLRTCALALLAAALALLPTVPHADAQACNPDAGSCIETH